MEVIVGQFSEELNKKLTEINEEGRFLITISKVTGRSKDGGYNFNHYWITKDFPKEDVVHCLDHIIEDFRTKQTPKNKKNKGNKKFPWQ